VDHLSTAERLGGPLNDLSACCLAMVMHCATKAKDENKEVGTEFIPQMLLALLYLFLLIIIIIVVVNLAS
jgi:ABC-type transporter Mla MlaB component